MKYLLLSFAFIPFIVFIKKKRYLTQLNFEMFLLVYSFVVNFYTRLKQNNLSYTRIKSFLSFFSLFVCLLSSVPDLPLPGPWARMKFRAPSTGLQRFQCGGLGKLEQLQANEQTEGVARGQLPLTLENFVFCKLNMRSFRPLLVAEKYIISGGLKGQPSF